jgi:hypothetical protein
LQSQLLTPFPDLEESAPLDDLDEPDAFSAAAAASVPPGLTTIEDVSPIWELRPPVTSESPWIPTWVQVSPRLRPPPLQEPNPNPWEFRHTPARTKLLTRRWPSALESQACSTPLVLHDFLIWVQPFLDPSASSALERTSRAFALGPTFGPLWLYRPWSPHRRRRWGFGIPSKQRIATHDSATYHSILHFVWTYLAPADRKVATKVSSAWSLYHQLRIRAATTSLAPLRDRRPPPGNPNRLPEDRALLYSCALLRFHFYYGDFVRWLGGEYTNRHRNWETTFRTLHDVCTRPPPIDLPPADFPRGFCICTEGVPLTGHFDSPSSALDARDKYDNHPAVDGNFSDVEAKFAKEEEKSFHIHLPRFLLFFIFGLIINPIQWAVRKGKGRICIDCTNGPDGPDTTSSANTFIPGPKDNDPDACPPVHYATAFFRHLRHLWRFRITFPLADILQHCDDVDAAFRRVLYTPELAIVFAYVFGKYLLIPVGQVFGSRSAPSYFSLLSDIRAFVATCADLITGYPLHSLVAAAALPPEPLPQDLVPAIADSLNPVLTDLEAASHSNCTFVDDNGVAGLRQTITLSLHNSVIAAFLLFGWPDEDRRSSCLAPDKWERDIVSIMLYLGFLICSRSMTVTWPWYKRTELYDEIMTCLQGRRPSLTPKGVASMIGKLRSAALVAMWGPYLSYGLAQALKLALRSAFSCLRRFWARGKVWITKSMKKDMLCIAELLLEPQFSPVWSQYIGLLIPRDATHRIFSDASYAGIGGWSPDFHIQWRVMRDDLISLGFSMKIIDRYAAEPIDAKSQGLHINPLEFLGCIINLWLTIKLIASLPPCLTGYIVDLWSDNTSALSWMRLTASTRDPNIQPLARLTSTFLVIASQHLTRVQPRHIPGKLNIEADYLSRSENGRIPSWARVISQCSQLRTCQVCLLPRELLSSLAGLISSGLTEGTYVGLATHLLTLDYVTLPVGSMEPGTISSLRP